MARLTRLGIPGPLAEVYADHLDWHQIAGRMPSDDGVRQVAGPGSGARREMPMASDA